MDTLEWIDSTAEHVAGDGFCFGSVNGDGYVCGDGSGAGNAIGSVNGEGYGCGSSYGLGARNGDGSGNGAGICYGGNDDNGYGCGFGSVNDDYADEDSI